jgi:hypothetical protein
MFGGKLSSILTHAVCIAPPRIGIIPATNSPAPFTSSPPPPPPPRTQSALQTEMQALGDPVTDQPKAAQGTLLLSLLSKFAMSFNDGEWLSRL